MADRGEQIRTASFLREMLRSITRVVARRPRIALWLVLLTCGACIGTTISTLKFKTSRADLIDPSASFHQRWLDYTSSFGEMSDVVVVAEGEDPKAIRLALDELGPRLDREPELFSNVLFRVEPGNLRTKGLQYLEPHQLEYGLNRIEEYKPVIRGKWDLVRIDSMAERLNRQVNDRAVGNRRHLRPLLDHADAFSTSLNGAIREDEQFRSPWPRLLNVDSELADQANRVVYLMNEGETAGFLKCHPVQNSDDFQGATASIKRLREILAEVSASHPEVSLGATGIPVLEYDEMVRSQADMTWASFISFGAVGLLLLFGFRGLRHPLLALLMLAVGMCWAFGYTTMTVGHLNILSVSFAAILIGLGIDFAIHYLARYLELRHEGHMLRPALLETSGSVGTGIVTAAITTALAFFCATFTDFLGVAELGLIAAGGILLCALATFVVLPALIAVADKNVEPKRLPTPFKGNLLKSMTSRFPVPVMVVSMAAIAVLGTQCLDFEGDQPALRVNYDYNLLNLQAKGLESVELQNRMFDETNDSLLYAVSIADSPEEALELREQFEQLPTVSHVEEMASRLPKSSEYKTRLLVQGYKAQLTNLPQRAPSLPTPDPARFGMSLERLLTSLKRLPDEPSAVHAAGELDEFLNAFDQMQLRNQLAFLNEFQYRSTSALLAQFQALYRAADPDPVTLADLPGELTNRFVSEEGKWLVQVFPNEQIWDIEPLEQFVNDVRSVDPEATGTPLQNFEASRQIMQSYEAAAIFALAVIFIVLLVDFLKHEHRLMVLAPPAVIAAIIGVSLRARGSELSPLLLVTVYLSMTVAMASVIDFKNLRDAMLSLLPPLGGAVMMFGVFGLAGIDLNPANLIVLPLVLGIGVDDGVHVVHDFRQQAGKSYKTSSSTINAIIMTSLTTMTGFASLMLASHQGLFSVGLVMVIGVGSCLFVSLVALPPVLTMIARSEQKPVAEQKVEAAPRQQQRRKAA